MTTTIKISGVVGVDVLARNLNKDLDKAAGADIDVHISSPGGSVFEGLEIYNLFRDYKRKYPYSKLNAVIKGIAASMASYLACNPAFNTLGVEDNSILMIHNAQGLVAGDYRDMEKTSGILKSINQLLAKAYADKTGSSLTEIMKKMDEETWFYGDEIVSNKFADKVIETGNSYDRKTAISASRLQFAAMAERLKTENGNDLSKIAAMIQGYPGSNDGMIRTPQDLFNAVKEAKQGINNLNKNYAVNVNPDGLIDSPETLFAQIKKDKEQQDRLRGIEYL